MNTALTMHLIKIEMHEMTLRKNIPHINNQNFRIRIFTGDTSNDIHSLIQTNDEKLRQKRLLTVNTKSCLVCEQFSGNMIFIQRRINVDATSGIDDVASTLMRRCKNLMCPLGKFYRRLTLIMKQ